MKVELKHQNGFHSVSNDRGHGISIDTTSSDEPQGPSPMELLLMGVAGCSSIDIVSILNKQKIKPDSLHIQVDGDRIKGQVLLYLRKYTLSDCHWRCACGSFVSRSQLSLKSIAQFQKH